MDNDVILDINLPSNNNSELWAYLQNLGDELVFSKQRNNEIVYSDDIIKIRILSDYRASIEILELIISIVDFKTNNQETLDELLKSLFKKTCVSLKYPGKYMFTLVHETLDTLYNEYCGLDVSIKLVIRNIKIFIDFKDLKLTIKHRDKEYITEFRIDYDTKYTEDKILNGEYDDPIMYMQICTNTRAKSAKLSIKN